MSLLLLKHFKEEARLIVYRLAEKRTPACTPPIEARLLRLHMLCTENAVSAVDPIHGPTKDPVWEWSQNAKHFVVSMRLLETLGSIMFADQPRSPSTDTIESIASAHKRLFSCNVAMLEEWVHVMRARAVEDYAKVSETLFVEAW